MSASMSLRQRMEATARAFLCAYEEGSVQNDASIINHNVTADCTRYLLPASVPLVCVDINPATVTKLADRGSSQARGVVTDIGLFLEQLAGELSPGWNQRA